MNRWAGWSLAADAKDRDLEQSPGGHPRAFDRPDARPAISIADLNQLRIWIDSKPDGPEGDWFKDFGSFKICGQGSLPKTFLLRGQAAKGEAV